MESWNIFFFFFFHLNVFLKEKETAKTSIYPSYQLHLNISYFYWTIEGPFKEKFCKLLLTWKSKFNFLLHYKTWETHMLILGVPASENWIPKHEACWGHCHSISLQKKNKQKHFHSRAMNWSTHDGVVASTTSKTFFLKLCELLNLE